MREKSPKVGDRAPEFTLLDQHGSPVALADLCAKGSVILFFYPKDFSTGCTAEACGFRDSIAEVAGASVVGISRDSSESHSGFAQKHGLPFRLLADEDEEVSRAYGVGSAFGIRGRVTFVIDRLGFIRHRFSSQLQAARHVREAVRALRHLG